jgi:hypothetical protein
MTIMPRPMYGHIESDELEVVVEDELKVVVELDDVDELVVVVEVLDDLDELGVDVELNDAVALELVVVGALEEAEADEDDDEVVVTIAAHS